MRKDMRKGETEKNREKRMEVYRHAMEMARKISRVADRILAGETETTACLMEGVDKSWMRRFIRGDISIKKGDETGSGIVEVDRNDWASWQDLFLEDLTGREYYAPPGFNSIYEKCVAEACNVTEREVLRLRFQEGLTLRETGERIGKSQERVRQVESKALRVLRHPRYRLRLAYGPEYTKAVEEAEDAQAAYDKARLAKMAELVEERKAAVLVCRDRCAEANRKMAEPYAEAAKEQEGRPSLEDVLDEIPLENMGLSVRAYNALTRHRVWTKGGESVYKEPVRTVGQLSRLTHEDLCVIRNLGKRSVDEIEQALLTQYGIRIGTEQK